MLQLICHEQIQLGAASETSEALTVNLCDVAVTPQGTVIVALHDEGFREYGSSGQQLSYWKPPLLANDKPDSICTLGVLHHDRVVVGLHHKFALLVLDRGQHGGWVTRDTIGLDICPWHLAVRSDSFDSVAVTGRVRRHACRSDGFCGTGNSIRVINVTGHEETLQFATNYAVKALTLTENFVVAMSYCKERTDLACLVVAYDVSSGEEKWRYEDRSRQVTDLCASGRTDEVYVAVYDADVLMAISNTSEGVKLEAVGHFEEKSELQRFRRTGEEQVWLAVSQGWVAFLCEDGKVVHMFRRAESISPSAFRRVNDWQDTAGCDSPEVPRQLTHSICGRCTIC